MRALHILRERGYTLRAEKGELLIDGPTPSDPAAMLKWLADHKADLMSVLAIEAHPVVSDVIDLFGAKLKETRLPDGRVVK